jgi:acetyl esterase/lipase
MLAPISSRSARSFSPRRAGPDRVCRLISGAAFHEAHLSVRVFDQASGTTEPPGKVVVDLCDPRLPPLLADDLSNRPPTLSPTGGFDPLLAGARTLRNPRGLRAMPGQRAFGSQVDGFVTLFPLGGDIATAATAVNSALSKRPCALPRP